MCASHPVDLVDKMRLWIKRFAALMTVASVGLSALFFSVAWMNGMHPIAGLLYLLLPNPTPVERSVSLQTVGSQRVSWLANIENRALSEANGLLASDTQPGIFWSINDSGNTPQLFAFDHKGADRGVWTVMGSRIVDWEAMDGFTDAAGQAYIVIGDVGDNLHWRPSLQIYVVPEPTTGTGAAGNERFVDSAWDFDFRLPDGPMDIEALAVDQANERVLLVTKRTQPPKVYSVPLYPDLKPLQDGGQKSRGATQERGEVIAQHVADLVHLPTPTAIDKAEDPREWRSRHMPTGMDIAEGKLFITTYKDAYLY